jgi:hypothetical protein
MIRIPLKRELTPGMQEKNPKKKKKDLPAGKIHGSDTGYKVQCSSVFKW